MFSQCPRLFKELIGGDSISAKEYLKGKFRVDKQKEGVTELERIKVKSDVDGPEYKDLLSNYEKSIISVFGHHTIEALLVYMLSRMLWRNSSVPLATFIERIENAVRNHAKMSLASQGGQTDLGQAGGVVNLRYPFGKALLEFLVERRVIRIVNKEGDSSKMAKKKNKSYYLVKSLHVECLINPAELPIVISLPMVCPPLDWSYKIADDQSWLNITDLYGGYLLGLSNEVYDRCRILSSWNEKQFR